MSDANSVAQLKGVGVDYITATSHQRGHTTPLLSFGRWLVSEEVSRGCKDSDFRATGYHGRHAGGVAFGVSQQGSIVKLSGGSALEHWAQLLCLADNVTRLDLAVTVLPVAGSTATLSRHHSELINAPRGRGKPQKFKVFYGPSGIEGMHIGRRVSDRFGRAYDKGIESKRPEYVNCVRYELELHREVALKTALLLDSQELDQALILSHVRTFMVNRGLKSAVIPQVAPAPGEHGSSKQDCSLFVPAPDIRPEVTKALQWMNNSVKPAVRRLIESGHREAVLRALGLLSDDTGKAN